MSSHHIVREKQEPALLVLSLAHFTDEELGQLLEWSPTLIATAETAEQLAIYDIKVDCIIGEANSSILQSDIKYIADGWQLPLQAAMGFLIEQGYPAVNIVTDDWNLNTYSEYVNQITMVIFCKKQKIYPITSGFSKWKPAGEMIALLQTDAELQVEGLVSLTYNEYQTVHDGFFKIKFTQPYLFIAEAY